ncbi:hypothetical protein M3Y99_01262700 [Aphelenchoides fujianensis]|nr:hypothetical protein M3Y99_01262700 [Aphelenchoides fujianensis]
MSEMIDAFGEEDRVPLPPPPPQHQRFSQFAPTAATPPPPPAHARCTSWSPSTVTSVRSSKTTPAPEPPVLVRLPSTHFPISTIRSATTVSAHQTPKCRRFRHPKVLVWIAAIVSSVLIVAVVGALSYAQIVDPFSITYTCFLLAFIGTSLAVCGFCCNASPIRCCDWLWKISLLLALFGCLVLLIVYHFVPGPFVEAYDWAKAAITSLPPQVGAVMADRPEVVAFAVCGVLLLFAAVVGFVFCDCFCCCQWKLEHAEKKRARDERPGGKLWIKRQSVPFTLPPSTFERRHSWEYEAGTMNTTTFPSMSRSCYGQDAADLPLCASRFVRIPRGPSLLDEEELESTLV